MFDFGLINEEQKQAVLTTRAGSYNCGSRNWKDFYTGKAYRVFGFREKSESK